MLVENQRRKDSEILEVLRNFGGCRSSRRRPLEAAFTHIADPASISFKLALAGVLARFLRLKVRDVVCHLSELRVASIHLELSALAVVTGTGLPPLPDATEADKQGDIRCQREVTAVRRR
jgi:hypothetical protein